MGETHKLTTAEIAKDKRLKSIYKISLDRYNQTMAEQDGKCAICLRDFSKFQPYVDHDHKCCPRRKKLFCGKCNRGLLCFICNKWAIGLIEKLTKQGVDFMKALVYIKWWNAKIHERGGYAKEEKGKKLLKK